VTNHRAHLVRSKSDLPVTGSRSHFDSLKARSVRAAILAIALLSAGLVAINPSGSIVVIGAISFASFLVVVRKNERWALIIWLALLAAFPPWIVIPLGPIHKILTIPAAASIVVILGRLDRTWPRFTAVDGVISVLFGLLLLGELFHLVPAFILDQAVLQWGLCYVAGRKLFRATMSEITTIMATFGAILGTLAILQTMLEFNAATMPILNHTTRPIAYQLWAPLQYRGGILRAELTFGHSIALGATLALCLPFALQRYHTRKYAIAALVIGLGTACTLSRGALVAEVIIVTFAILNSSYKPEIKLALTGLFGIVMIPLYSAFTTTVYSSAQSASEATSSAAYRSHLLGAFHFLRPVGIAISGATIVAGQNVDFHGFRSLDNSFLYVGLYAGLFAAILYFLPLLQLVVRAFRTGWRPIDIAILGQLALFVSVAPLTQYQNILWLTIGLAVSRSVSRRQESRGLSERSSLESGFRQVDE
jgi:hypothetical protein